MSFTSILAQVTTYEFDTTTTSNLSDGQALAITAGVLFFYFIFIVIAYVIGAILLMQIFKKAGAPGWAAWVPVYNNWKLLEIGKQHGFWAVLAFIPFVNIVSIVFMYIAMYHIGKSLGKGDAFVVLAIFLPIVWLIWLAVDKSTWEGAPAVAATPAPTDSTPPAAPQV